MDRLEVIKRWIDSHRDWSFDFLRIYLGIGLFVKGISFVVYNRVLVDTMQEAQIAWARGMIAHYVILAHIFGGLLLTFGLLTRWAAVAQIPILLGAVFLVHSREGFFTPHQTLEFALFVLFALVVIAFAGGGRLSLDGYMAQFQNERKRSRIRKELYQNG